MSQMYTDEDVEDLIRINIELTKENNAMLKAMRRSHWWSVFFKFLWLVVLIGGPTLLYYWYLAPYVKEAQALYQDARKSVEQMREMQAQVQASVGSIPARISEVLRGE